MKEATEEVDAPEEKIVEVKKEEKVQGMDELLATLENTQKQLKEENDDLAELRRRVELTENNMYVHMHSVGNLRSCVEGVVQDARNIKKFQNNGGAHRMAKFFPSSKNIRLPKMPTTMKHYDGKMETIKAKVDRDLGVKSEKEETVKKVVRLSAGNNKEKKAKPPVSKGQIMSSLINITGRMAEFSETIGQVLAFGKNGKKV